MRKPGPGPSHCSSDWSYTMAKCEICNKAVLFGNNVSHSNAKTSRIWRPNIRRIRVMENGRRVRRYVCTRCIRSGKIQKAV
jgi:large subunit ribosomal protein L28